MTAKSNVKYVLDENELPKKWYNINADLPKPLDPRVLLWVAPAVAKAAMDGGVARLKVDLEEYRERLKKMASGYEGLDDGLDEYATTLKMLSTGPSVMTASQAVATNWLPGTRALGDYAFQTMRVRQMEAAVLAASPATMADEQAILGRVKAAAARAWARSRTQSRRA